MRAYLLLGSNLGDRLRMIENALVLIGYQTGDVVAASSLYVTEPWGFTHENDFINQAVCIETVLPPEELLARLKQIERDLGRTRTSGQQYIARTIDLDILFYDNRVSAGESLTVPHPRLHERMFTLMPLAEIAPDLVHPVLNKNITELLQDCKNNSAVGSGSASVIHEV